MRNVLIVSQRQRPDGFGRQPGYASFAEAEDVLAAAADADMVMVDRCPADVWVRARRVVGRAMRRFEPGTSRDPVGRLLPGRPGTGESPILADRYDVAVFVAYTPWDFPLLERLHAVRRRAEHIVVWVPEAWSSEFGDTRLQLEPFSVADHIYVGMEAAADRLAGVTKRPVHHVPPAVDAELFAARNAEAPRPIDVLGIGRRDERLHRALTDWARDTDRLYIYDTISGTSVSDIDAHRANLAETYRRTKVAITNYAKYDQPSVIGTERETPGRMWEGLASGTLMIGYAPDAHLQKKVAGERVVADLPVDVDGAVARLDELCASDASAVRRHHVRLALRNHDWIHRWREIFRLSDLPLPDGFGARITALDAQAAGVGRPRDHRQATGSQTTPPGGADAIGESLTSS